jgi:hypothetical protein
MMGKLATLSPPPTFFGPAPPSARASYAGVEARTAAGRLPFSVAAKSATCGNEGLDTSIRPEPDAFLASAEPAADSSGGLETAGASGRERALHIVAAGFVAFALATLGSSFVLLAAAIRPH